MPLKIQEQKKKIQEQRRNPAADITWAHSGGMSAGRRAEAEEQEV